ncbi:MAG: NADH-quinone oxidoreductase subunit C [Geobacter sp.]|nr:NADH-quinone oxidoreductase subunit C [Geobacter sp.]
MNDTLRLIYNGRAIACADIPSVDHDRFLQTILEMTGRGWRVSSYCGFPVSEAIVLYCLLASPADGVLGIMQTVCNGSEFPSIAVQCPQVQLFEREIAEQCGIRFVGHPWFKPVRFVHSAVRGHDAWGRADDQPIQVGVMDYYRVEGEEIHEVAVGPVHAGVIEPGHFRFQCHGEQVFHLEISLGYQHRGIEQLLVGGPHPQTLRQMEAIAGDTSIGHGQAYCMVVEALSKTRPPAAAEALRGVALELERLANHTGDLGAIAGDVGYLPTSSFCGRIRGDFLNMSAFICGSRFGRGLLKPGGTVFGLDQAQREELQNRLATGRAELTSAIELLWNTPSVMSRLEGAGVVSAESALEMGLVGPAARACSLKRDVRSDYPFGIYRMAQVPIATAHHGDVCSRSMVRWEECQKSLDFCVEQLRQLPSGAHAVEPKPLLGDHLTVALTEGWRGEICHLAITGPDGRFKQYKICDPSFHNWQGLAMALRNEQISDFPLCNKSFNLSYCGFDL